MSGRIRRGAQSILRSGASASIPHDTGVVKAVKHCAGGGNCYHEDYHSSPHVKATFTLTMTSHVSGGENPNSTDKPPSVEILYALWQLRQQRTLDAVF
ncbi:hypothetical protein DMENIID0001_109020 [Sergentomyia squamirostris]